MKSNEQLEKMYADLESRVNELEGIKNPQNIQGKIETLFDEISSLTDKISLIMNKLQTINLDKKYLELFTNDEIKNYYNISGLSLNDVLQFIKKYTNENNISLMTASRYVTGKINDLETRNKIGKFLREAAIESNREKKQIS